MSEPVRWGVLGAANIARKAVIPAMRGARNSRLVAVASRLPERAAAFAAEAGAPVAYGSYAELVADRQVEAIYIPLPNHLHAEWAIRAAEAGKHVLCEKPLALNAAEAQAMADAARRSGTLLMEAFMYRFHPRSLHIRELVRRGAIGELRMARSAFCFLHPDPLDHRFTPAFGGGALLDVGCYGVSLACWMFDALPERVAGFAHFGSSGIDLSFAGVLHFPGGGLATIEASFVTALQQSYTLAGTSGVIELPHDAFVPFEHDARFTLRGVNDPVGTTEVIPAANQYTLMVEHFADAVRGLTALVAPPDASISTMQVLDALMQSARSGKMEVVGQ